MGKILVTGANGFVGRALCARLSRDGIPYLGVTRNLSSPIFFAIGEMSHLTKWDGILSECDTVVHLAARVHVMHDNSADPLTEFRRINVDATLCLAQAAVKAGVRRFVFVSSIKVNGESTFDSPFKRDDRPAPQDSYGLSKLEAEIALKELADETGLELVIVRPPLVYGPGVKANFLNLMRIIRSGIPLPFGYAYARRGMVAIDNLVDLLVLCTRHPSAAGKIYLVSDGEDLRVVDLVRILADAANRSLWLVPIPLCIISVLAKLFRKKVYVDRIFSSLEIDISETKVELGWSPTTSAKIALANCMNSYSDQKNNEKSS